MAAARSAVRGLTTDELQTIAEALGNGRKPKVVFTEAAGQIAGQTGQVVSLADPAATDEWVVVRFGRDELPFSPADLRMAPRGPVKRVEPRAVPVVAAPPEPEFVIDRPVPAPREEQRAAAPAGAQRPGGAGRSAEPRPAPQRPDPQPAVTAPQPTAQPGAAQPAKAARRPARGARPKGPASLTVTLAYADGEWTVAANQGSKALAKPYVVKPAEALKMVALVDVPGVREAVESIMSAERAEAEQQADKLRAELAEIEARLAELRDAG